MHKELHDKTLLIDGDIILYRCGFASEKTKYLVSYEEYTQDGNYQDHVTFDTAKEAKAFIKKTEVSDAHAPEYFTKCTLWSRKELEPLENCLQIVKTSLLGIVQGRYSEQENPDLAYKNYELYLSGPTNFRNEIAKTKKYKGNRDETRKPTWSNEIKEYLVNEWGAIHTTDIEADDAIGIRAGELGESGCIVSTDKDLDQIAGWHFNWVDGRVYRTSPREADFAFYKQVLTGDPTDNIPGLDGVGPKTAEEILGSAANTGELLERVKAAYRDRYGSGWELYLKEQGNLVYILRHGEKPEWLV